eukprot:CAMPEP_0169485754 /NCGR_PEP_ID=MMETSP1042-20121227/32460_1 /TAXON_ID=464988 /ORGANISM="Hemiselmis andersenii, Strain CCMP1180" /LENGTH=212 /DNA_ID=CAMNT_0009600875 /DNA_START=1371 /DNA_END=2010 /DNA_ORIENTATION=-
MNHVRRRAARRLHHYLGYDPVEHLKHFVARRPRLYYTLPALETTRVGALFTHCLQNTLPKHSVGGRVGALGELQCHIQVARRLEVACVLVRYIDVGLVKDKLVLVLDVSCVEGHEEGKSAILLPRPGSVAFVLVKKHGDITVDLDIQPENLLSRSPVLHPTDVPCVARPVSKESKTAVRSHKMLREYDPVDVSPSTFTEERMRSWYVRGMLV